ncbi:MAG: four helix bundle protein [Verrucomicrobiae bacterium]|nr:four helix bundle protein [Verrucomicrobiae bacterium]
MSEVGGRRSEVGSRMSEGGSQKSEVGCRMSESGRNACYWGQMLRSGTSVAANYREASRARSDAEFISKIEICTQEADETVLWLELLRDECNIQSRNLEFLLKESDELISIFVTMSKNKKGEKNSLKQTKCP